MVTEHVVPPLGRSMKRTIALFAALLPLALNAAEPPNRLSAEEEKQGFRLMFNGKNLEGWDGDPAVWSVKDGDPAVWSVKDGEIVGSSEGAPLKHNTFLIYRARAFSDFVMRVDLKLRNHNSGIQFRSQELPEWVMTGYQADASEAKERSAWGNLYEEKGRGRGVMKSPDQGWLTGQKIYHKGEWNTYEITAKGDRIRLVLNGVETLDLTDAKAADGLIGLQCHMGEPMRVEFRNLRIRPLR
jgi:hypothetical protein